MSTETLSKVIRVMLVDDHVIVRMGVSFALNNQDDMEVVAQAQDGVEAMALYREHQPDVVVMDLRMPKQNGMETIALMRREFGSAHILVLSNYDSGEDISAAIQAGAYGFVVKDTSLTGLLDAIRQVDRGEQYLPPSVARRLASRIHSQLSVREIEVLSMLGKGLSNKEIGSSLSITESTVKVHLAKIFAKLEVADRTQAVLTGIKSGIIHLE